MSVVMMVRVMIMPHSMAVLFMANLIRGFDLYGAMHNAVVFQLISHHIFYGMGLLDGDYMHSGVMVMPVKASDVNMMNICYTVNGKQVIFYLLNTDILRCFFEKNIDYSLYVF